jgi:cob(I)alamin adenosyltransferase
MSPFYTRSGDDGTTGVLGKGRLSKHHPRIEALGTLDEASAALGLARALGRAPQTAPLLLEAQRDLYKLMAEVAATPEQAERFRSLDRPRLEWLEAQAAALEAVVPIPGEFILPGDTPAGAALSLGRAVVRRAERRVAELLDSGDLDNPLLLQYLNRLSSLCFILELLENQQAGQQTNLAKEE